MSQFWAKAKSELGRDGEALGEFFGDDFRRAGLAYAGSERRICYSWRRLVAFLARRHPGVWRLQAASGRTRNLRFVRDCARKKRRLPAQP